MFLAISGGRIFFLRGRIEVLDEGQNMAKSKIWQTKYLVTFGMGPWWMYNIGVRSLG